jgi:hypothetical protein
MEVTVVLPEHYNAVWPLIRDYMDGAAKYTYGRFTVEDIRKGLDTSPQQLWVAYEGDEVYGAVVTEFVIYPQIKALVMHFTGGKELPKWKPQMLAILQKFGKENDCNIIESYGRAGWAKVFENDGFVSRFMFYELPVEN